MISSRQIKAARALLGWTQGDLAQQTGLHLNAINKIETGLSAPRVSTLDHIRASFESAGIHFRGQRGVEVKEDVFEILRCDGADFIRRLIDDVLARARGSADEVLTCTPDERLFNLTDTKQNERYYRQMKKTGFSERCITGQHYRLFTNRKQTYRWLPAKALGTITYVVYGDRVAFVNWAMQEVLIVRNKALASTFGSQFEFLWQQAKPFA